MRSAGGRELHPAGAARGRCRACASRPFSFVRRVGFLGPTGVMERDVCCVFTRIALRHPRAVRMELQSQAWSRRISTPISTPDRRHCGLRGAAPPAQELPSRSGAVAHNSNRAGRFECFRACSAAAQPQPFFLRLTVPLAPALRSAARSTMAVAAAGAALREVVKVRAAVDNAYFCCSWSERVVRAGSPDLGIPRRHLLLRESRSCRASRPAKARACGSAGRWARPSCATWTPTSCSTS
jgi:hypothetical protein